MENSGAGGSALHASVAAAFGSVGECSGAGHNVQAFDVRRKHMRVDWEAGRVRRKPVLTDVWRQHVAQHWSLPLQLLKGRSRQ